MASIDSMIWEADFTHPGVKQVYGSLVVEMSDLEVFKWLYLYEALLLSFTMMVITKLARVAVNKRDRINEVRSNNFSKLLRMFHQFFNDLFSFTLLLLLRLLDAVVVATLLGMFMWFICCRAPFKVMFAVEFCFMFPLWWVSTHKHC